MSISENTQNGFLAFTKRFEGLKDFMYLDVKGLVTAGVGNLIDPIELALVLPWRREDSELATDGEVRSNWETVKAMPFGPRYAAECFRLHEGLHLASDDIEVLVLAHVNGFANWLEEHWFPEMGSYPDEVQTALLSMAWAMGPDFPRKFPRFMRAIRSRAWITAAQECTIPELGMASDGRNAANIKLLMSAPA